MSSRHVRVPQTGLLTGRFGALSDVSYQPSHLLRWWSCSDGREESFSDHLAALSCH